jgi:hypothetical protein
MKKLIKHDDDRDIVIFLVIITIGAVLGAAMGI